MRILLLIFCFGMFLDRAFAADATDSCKETAAKAISDCSQLYAKARQATNSSSESLPMGKAGMAAGAGQMEAVATANANAWKEVQTTCQEQLTLCRQSCSGSDPDAAEGLHSCEDKIASTIGDARKQQDSSDAMAKTSRDIAGQSSEFGAKSMGRICRIILLTGQLICGEEGPQPNLPRPLPPVTIVGPPQK